MTDTDAVGERLRAVERAVAEGDVDADLTDPTGELEARIDDLEATTTELESGLQAVRGYVGQVKSVDDEIERRADAAAAAVDDAEERIAALERRLDAGTVVDGDEGDVVDAGAVDDEDIAPESPPRGEDRPATRTVPSREKQQTAAAKSAHAPPETESRSRDRRRGDRPNSRRRPRSRSGSRRPTEPPSHPHQTRQPAENAANERYDREHRDGCPYCGGAGEGERDAETDRSSHRDGTKGSGGAPVDDVDERGVVARLRDAL